MASFEQTKGPVFRSFPVPCSQYFLVLFFRDFNPFFQPFQPYPRELIPTPWPAKHHQLLRFYGGGGGGGGDGGGGKFVIKSRNRLQHNPF